ncbi:MAG TPA: hypothetical protein VGM63_16655, partial [Mucilaginibacter sp.]
MISLNKVLGILFKKSKMNNADNPNNDFKSVRIEKIKPYQLDYEIETDTVWLENHNIEKCIQATHAL